MDPQNNNRTGWMFGLGLFAGGEFRRSRGEFRAGEFEFEFEFELVNPSFFLFLRALMALLIFACTLCNGLRLVARPSGRK
jgi:hypothetical protein